MMELPFITAMIVTYNEENYIRQCMESLLHQTYPSDKMELLIIDGGSKDKTLAIAHEVGQEYCRAARQQGAAPVKIAYYQNEKKILASGWNIGIQHAAGEYVVRIDAHAYAAPDFVEESVKTMFQVSDAACVGGAMETISDSDTGELIKEALSSPFGVGGSKFRYMKDPGYVDTVAYGLYRKSVFDQVGYFNESLVRTQDNDLHRRIREQGGKFYLNPSIKSFYYSRNNMKKLLKQQFQNGKWTMINFRRRPGKMALRHFIPLFFVLAVLVTVLAGLFFPAFFLLTGLGLFLHLACGCYFACKRTRNCSHRLKLPFVFLLMHICYGTGSVCGIFYKIEKSKVEL